MTGVAQRAAFLARVGHLAEHSPWVAERVADLGPFTDDRQVADAFARVLRTATPAEQLDLIRAHPDLAGRAALAGELTADSAREQASAGLDRLSAADLERFTRLNRAYRSRFGFPFVICVRRHTVASIMDAYEARIDNDPDTERAAAVEEIVAIIGLRLGVG